MFNKDAKDEIDAMVDEMLQLADEMENNDKIDGPDASNGTTSVLGKAPDDSQMIDELFNFDESNEAIRVAPVQETHETPSARFLT